MVWWIRYMKNMMNFRRPFRQSPVLPIIVFEVIKQSDIAKAALSG